MRQPFTLFAAHIRLPLAKTALRRFLPRQCWGSYYEYQDGRGVCAMGQALYSLPSQAPSWGHGRPRNPHFPRGLWATIGNRHCQSVLPQIRAASGTYRSRALDLSTVWHPALPPSGRRGAQSDSAPLRYPRYAVHSHLPWWSPPGYQRDGRWTGHRRRAAGVLLA